MNQRCIKLAVILPHVYRGGTVRLLANVMQYFQRSSNFELVLGLPTGHRRVIQGQLDVLDEHARRVEIREFDWSAHEPARAAELLARNSIEVGRMVSSQYCSMVESDHDFLDCDFWLFISDRITLTLLPFRPYGMLVTDHLQRYVPDIFGEGAYEDFNFANTNFLRNVRNADLAIATSTATYADLQSYSGARGQLLQMPTAVDVDYFLSLSTTSEDHSSRLFDRPYFIWVSNAAPHKNHLMSIDALKMYFESEKSNLDVVITGANTELFDPFASSEQCSSQSALYNLPYIVQVRDAFQAKLRPWRDRVKFAGELPDGQYSRVLRQAVFLLHNVIADNGTFSVIEAAIMGTPSISSSYPQMLELNEAFSLNMKFFDPFCAKSAAEALIHNGSLREPDPARINARIQEHHVSNWSDELERAIASCLAASRLKIECL